MGYMNHFLKRISLVLFVICILGFLNCIGASNSALPQASIPLPSNDPITISAPNAQGFVVISGAAESDIPDGAKIVIQVGAGNSALNLLQLFNPINSAHAQSTCQTDIPACPTLDGDRKCQVDSNSDGSFTVSVPAAASDSIAINYLDPTTCEETSAYTQTVSTDIQAIDLDVSSVVQAQDGSFYMLAQNSSNQTVVRRYNLTTAEEETFSDEALTGTGLKIDQFFDHQDNSFLVITTEDGVFIGSIESDGTIDLSEFITIRDFNDNVISDMQFVQAESLEYDPNVDTCVSASLFTTDFNYTRVTLHSQGVLYVMEFVNGLNDVDPGHISADGDWIPREIELSLDIVSTQVTGALGVVEDLYYSQSTADKRSLIFNQTVDQVPHTFVVRKINDEADFCQSQMIFDSPDSEFLNLGPATAKADVAPAYGFTNIDEGVSAMVINHARQSVTFLDLGRENLECLEDVISFNSNIDVLSGTTCTLDTDHNGDLDTDSIALLYALETSSGIKEVLLLGKNYDGFDFISEHDGEPLFVNSDESLRALNPVEMIYDTSSNAIIVFDKGLAEDHQTFILQYDLSETPVSVGP